MSKPPAISGHHKICIICEGYEDIEYFDRLISLNVWCKDYEFKTVNAKSASHIPARFQDIFQNDRYEVILIFCDTDKAPYREYNLIKQKINRFLNRQKAAEKLIIFANPCTMQIILSHFGDVALKNQGKKTNSEIIEKLTGVQNYDAHEEQIKIICEKIFRRSYPEMKRRIKAIDLPDTTSCSTNFSRFLDCFENEDHKWITDIRSYLFK